MIHLLKKRHGFATTVSLVSLTLVGITIAGLMSRIAMQVRRTDAEINRAQRNQIMIARSLGNSVKLPAELGEP